MKMLNLFLLMKDKYTLVERLPVCSRYLRDLPYTDGSHLAIMGSVSAGMQLIKVCCMYQQAGAI